MRIVFTVGLSGICSDHSCANFIWTHVFISLEYTTRSGIAVSYTLKILRNFQTISQNVYTFDVLTSKAYSF